MDWFTNMYSPITERTNITPTLEAYNNAWYNSAFQAVMGMPQYNFTGGQTQNYGWNYFQNNNWNGSIFGFDTSANQNYNPFSLFKSQYNFTGSGRIDGTSNRVSTPVKPNKTNAASQQQQKPKVTRPNTATANNFAKSIASTAEQYVGYNESDGSFRKFTNDPEWCADFVTYVVKEAYRKQGKLPPPGFGSWRCENLKQWAISNNKFLFTANKANQQDLIKTKVKPGDIVIMREHGASHTGIVRYVDRETGNYQTIEGNVTAQNGIDYVLKMNHRYNDPEVSGFIQLV